MNHTLICIFCILLILFFYNYQFKEGFIDNNQKSNLNVIIPIRDREDDLNEYLKNMIPILEEQKINYKIFIIEQSHKEKLFNKAKINNIGFIEAKKNNNIDRFLFNDVDNYPLKRDFIDFTKKIEGVHHFFGFLFCIGGIYLFSKSDFEKINGFSNEYYGWGTEDEDLLARINIFKIKVLRDVFVSRDDNVKKQIIRDVIVENKVKNDKHNIREFLHKKINTYKSNKDTIFQDGINTCEYKIVKVINNYDNNKNIKRILVDI